MTVYDLIEKHEGRKAKPYKCPAGHDTIGVGWNMEANPLPPAIAEHLKKHGRITQEMIDELFQTSVRQAVADCRVLFPEFDLFSDARRMALIDFVFQLGFARARRFVHSIAAINTNRWADAAKEMLKSRWAEQTPKRAETITDMIEEG